jgi:hypothetical protein
MDQTRDTPGTAQAVRIIHAALVAGVLLAGGTFAFMVRSRGHAPEGGETLGIVLPALGIGLLLVSASVLRRRVPERRSQQSSDGYWAAVETRGAAIVLWAVTEGAALVSLVGYFLSGAPAASAVAVVALVALILYRPSRLERAA